MQLERCLRGCVVEFIMNTSPCMLFRDLDSVYVCVFWGSFEDTGLA